MPRKGPGRHTFVSSLFSHLLYKGLFSKVTPSNLLRAINLFSDFSRGGQTLLDIPPYFDEITGGITLADLDDNDYRRYVEASQLVAEKVDLIPGAGGLIINGRVRAFASIPFSKHDVPRMQIVGPIASGDFVAEDYQALQDYELVKRVQPVLSALEDVIPDFPGRNR